MATVARMAVSMTLASGEFIAGMKASADRIRAFGAETARASSRGAAAVAHVRVQFDRLRSSIAAGAVSLRNWVLAAVGIRAVIGAVRQFEWAGEMWGRRIRTGIATADLMALEWAAKQAEVSVESLTRAVTYAQRMLGSVAAGGAKKAAEAFEALQLNAKALAAKNPIDALMEIIGALETVENQYERVAIAARIFGKASSIVNQLVVEGKEGFAKAADDIRRFGLALRDAELALIEQAGDAIDRMKLMGRGFIVQMQLRIAPVISSMINRFVDWATSGRTVAEMVDWIAEKLWRLVDLLVTTAQRIHAWWLRVKAGFADLKQALIGGLLEIAEVIDLVLTRIGIDAAAGWHKRMQERWARSWQDWAHSVARAQAAAAAAAQHSWYRGFRDWLSRFTAGARDAAEQAADRIAKLTRGAYRGLLDKVPSPKRLEMGTQDFAAPVFAGTGAAGVEWERMRWAALETSRTNALLARIEQHLEEIANNTDELETDVAEMGY